MEESIHASMLCHKAAWSRLCPSNVYVDGKGVYKIGVLHLQDLGLESPINSDASYPRLRCMSIVV